MMAAVAAAVAETELPPVERPPALDRPPSLLDATPSFSPPSPSFTPAPPPAFAPAPSTMQLEPPPSPGFATQPAFEPPPVRMDVPLTAPVKPIPSEKPRSSGLIWFLLLVLVGAVLFLVYTFVVEPALRPVHVQVLPAPAAHEVVQSFPGRGTALRAEAKALNFGEAGKIADIVAAGTELKEGMTIATLDGYAAVERELTDVRDREKYYAEQLKAAQAKGNAAAVKQAEGKANEKKKRIVELEERAKRVRLVAPGVATVTEALVKAGDAVKAGDPIAKVADQRLMAQFKLPPGESANLRAGRQVQVAPEGGSALAAAKVMAVDQDTVRVDLLENAGGAIKVDTPVVLVKSKVADAVSLPPIAVSRNASGGDQVFVFADGVVRARPVTVIDRTPKVVVLGPGGLQPGEQVVISPTDQLTDGQRASISE
jgi:multidrug efflux pump subunit AcrA (membrane-fusion protein)